MIQEIGSEFHQMPLETGQGLSYPHAVDEAFVFSGRTALETVIKNLPQAKTALLPSYCCQAMIEPFSKAGRVVYFYSVNFFDKFEINLDTTVQADILLWTNYFGFRFSMPNIRNFINRGGIVIEDITHSFLSDKQYHPQSHYLVASLRKWEPVYSGGYCASMHTSLKYKPTLLPSDEFLTCKKQAMQLKDQYIHEGRISLKDDYISKFAASNRWLTENYSGTLMDSDSRNFLSHADIERQRKIRRQNVRVLYERLKGKVQFMFPIDDMDCPLFVPILVPNRDEIRKILIENEIYCPIHWPKPEGCMSNIYDRELSLICDQRYGIEHMERIASTLMKVI